MSARSEQLSEEESHCENVDEGFNALLSDHEGTRISKTFQFMHQKDLRVTLEHVMPKE